MKTENDLHKVPVLVLAFNRADHVAKAMNAIREYRPEKLYLECDGARADKIGEKESVELTRQTMLSAVDWPCEVKTLFRDNNLGCANAVNDAITWFFENEEYGIICEDDMVIGLDFFKLSEELLPRYANEDRIMCISSRNHSRRTDISNTYVYSCRSSCWGWASWARAWKKMDMTMSAYPTLTYKYLITRLGLFEGIMTMRSFKNGYKHIVTFNSWATRWYLSVLANNGLVIVPGVNLSINIGIDGGVHFEKGDIDPFVDLKICELTWPIKYNDSFKIDKKQAQYDAKDYLHLRMIGLQKKIRKLFKGKRVQ